MDLRNAAHTPGRARLSKRWLLASGLCLFAAAVFLLRGNADVAFVAAVLAILAWFLNVRARLRKDETADSADRE